MKVGWFDELMVAGLIVARISIDATPVRVLVKNTFTQLVLDTASTCRFTYCFWSELEVDTYDACYNTGSWINGYVQVKFMKVQSNTWVCLSCW